MRKLLLSATICLLIGSSYAQSTVDYCIRVTANVQQNPARVTLHWPADTAGISNYTIARKTKAANFFGPTIATLPQTATSFTDTAVVSDSAYEYRVRKTGTITADGYIYCGIQQPLTEYRGKLLLLVDSLLNDSLATELNRLMKDISGDGWALKRFDVSQVDPDYTLKDLIHAEYLADSANLQAVLLVGSLAVPYSGDINPDGHPDHLGAWPADVYYGNMALNFTDYAVNDSLAGRVENRNVPDDLKWDQSTLSGNKIQLQVSRIDFHKMTAFNKTETELMKTYLDKDHAYRMKYLSTKPRALIDDNFGAFGGEAFAISGWRNFSPILGDTNIVEADYVTTLDTANYQWSYGCGGGWFQGAGGVGTSSDFASHNVNTIFSMLFGSYFGDWDSDNDFLRAPLCSANPALTCCWAGRPHWIFHHMALGENIGYSARLTQNQTGICYDMNYGINFTHVALMGDLTLRQHIIAPPVITTLSDTNENVALTWLPSTDSVLGYYVYRSNTEFGRYYRVNQNMLTGTNFTEVGAGPGLKFYMVRACKLETTPSGTYYNLSEGIADSISVRDTVILASAISNTTNSGLNFSLHPNPATETVYLNFSQPVTENTEVEISDISGRVINKATINTGAKQIRLDVSSFADGFYFCHLHSHGQTASKRFEKISK